MARKNTHDLFIFQSKRKEKKNKKQKGREDNKKKQILYHCFKLNQSIYIIIK